MSPGATWRNNLYIVLASLPVWNAIPSFIPLKYWLASIWHPAREKGLMSSFKIIRHRVQCVRERGLNCKSSCFPNSSFSEHQDPFPQVATSCYLTSWRRLGVKENLPGSLPVVGAQSTDWVCIADPTARWWRHQHRFSLTCIHFTSHWLEHYL